MASFEQNNRRQQELAMRPVIDAIYNRVWPGCVIERFERTEDLVLDIRFAIDVKVTMPNGMILLGQEKALSYAYRTFRTVTVEYMQNPQTDERGDWFNLAAQFYFCGYCAQNMQEFDPWVILNWADVVEFTRRNIIKWDERGNNKTTARASYKFTAMDDLPRRAIMFSGGLLIPTTSTAKSDFLKPRQMSLMPEVKQLMLGEDAS